MFIIWFKWIWRKNEPKKSSMFAENMLAFQHLYEPEITMALSLKCWRYLNLSNGSKWWCGAHYGIFVEQSKYNENELESHI